MNLSVIDSRIQALEQTLTAFATVNDHEPLLVGVDLGTAFIVVVVVNGNREPVACAMEYAQVVRDGLVVDYLGATRIVRRLVIEIEGRLGRKLTQAAIAVPPGTGAGDCRTHGYVVEAAGLEVVRTLDEPTAANAVLELCDGVIVDIGGGTTGLSILEGGRVVYVADEPTGGTHLSLVLAGKYRISLDEAEALKRQEERHPEILPAVRPVIQKMASIVKRHITGHRGEAIYLVGGTCCLSGMEQVMAQELGRPVFKPANPLLVTPLGIALNCTA